MQNATITGAAMGAPTGPDGTYLGLDVGGSNVKWAVVQGTGVCLRAGEVSTMRSGPDDLVAQLVDLAHSHGAAVDRIGLAMPGLVDIVARRTVFIPNLPGDWADFPLGDVIGAETSKPVALLNDARAFGYAELHVGVAQGLRDVLFLSLGTGIGGALARHGELLIEALDGLPEMGHVAVEPLGERCGCGASGCLETVASASAVVARTARAVLTGQSAMLLEMCDGHVENLTAKLVGTAADAGDPWALAALERAGTFIGMAAASCCVMLRTTTIVIGGGLAGAFSHLAPPIQRIVDARAALTGPVAVLSAQLGPSAGSIGAALYARSYTPVSSFAFSSQSRRKKP